MDISTAQLGIFLMEEGAIGVWKLLFDGFPINDCIVKVLALPKALVNQPFHHSSLGAWECRWRKPGRE